MRASAVWRRPCTNLSVRGHHETPRPHEVAEDSGRRDGEAAAQAYQAGAIRNHSAAERAGPSVRAPYQRSAGHSLGEGFGYNRPSMAEGNLLAIIKTKQGQIARLRTELAAAQALLAKIVDEAAPTARPRVGRWRRRSSTMLQYSPTAHEAAKILRRAGRPLHATAITKMMNRNGHKVALGTLVSTLSRWVNSRSVFYRVRPNVFGLVAQRQRRSPTTRPRK